ncbi:hypothetical protein [Sorangium sp. So ce341]|uniref:hypothetical protein n=1 Tax=Sorangium sp. So ce341 TaxID=3133302 RepID=UPI003F63D612
MSTATVTLALPEALYQRLKGTALATRQPLEAVMLRALSLGSPPAWDDAAPEFQIDLVDDLLTRAQAETAVKLGSQ